MYGCQWLLRCLRIKVSTKIPRHKLERLGNNRTLLETEETRHALDKEDIVLLASCIDRHIDAFEWDSLENLFDET